MFDFEKLEVYQKLRIANVSLLRYIHQGKCDDKFLADQLRRAALSVTLNLAEGVGRRTGPDKRRFITMARSSLYETMSILQILYDLEQIDQTLYDVFYEEYTAVSKMLLALYRSY